MADIEIRSYWPGDVALIDVRTEQLGELSVTNSSLDDGAAPAGVAHSLVRGQRVMMSAGICPIWEGRAVAWAVVGDLTRREWGHAISAMRRLLEDSRFERVEANCRVGVPVFGRFLEGLGFEREGVMRRFAGGEDFLLYARVKS